MRKIISVLMLVLLLVVVTGCTVEEKKTDDKNDDKVVRTYKADGTYMVWKLGTSNTDLLMPDGTKYTDLEGKGVKVATPALSTLKVTIYNDKVVNYEIDELQSKAYVKTNKDSTVAMDPETKAVKGVNWVFNSMSKRELEYGYGMEASGKQGEWFIQITNLENYFLENGPKSDDTIKASVTITFDNYVAMALEALQNAKDGKIGAITEKEHYTYDVTYVNADINEKGEISNVKLNAWLFGNAGENTYTPGHADYLKFAWNATDKYESYGAMSGGKKWQDQMDTLNAYINENGWDGSLLSGTTYEDNSFKDKGLNKGGVAVEALSSVTIQLSREVLVMNMLYKFFPKGWK